MTTDPLDDEQEWKRRRSEEIAEWKRSKKIGKIVPAMRRRGISSEAAESWTDGQWETLAQLVGVNVPSEKTRARIVRILMTEIQLDRVAS